MAFCMNCGCSVNEHANFCPKCGATTRKDHSANTDGFSERKVTYDGEIKKCPNCGEILKSFTPNCPSCGYELRNSRTTNYILEFSKKLEAAATSKQKDDLIRHFVMPNTKEDIYEFMILAASNLETDGDNTDAWLVKLEQAYQKAKYIFGDSLEIKPISNIYNNATKQYSKIKFKQKSKSFGSFLVKHWRGFVLAVLGLFGIICCIIAAQDYEKNNIWLLVPMAIGPAILWIGVTGIKNKGE